MVAKTYSAREYNKQVKVATQYAEQLASQEEKLTKERAARRKLQLQLKSIESSTSEEHRLELMAMRRLQRSEIEKVLAREKGLRDRDLLTYRRACESASATFELKLEELRTIIANKNREIERLKMARGSNVGMQGNFDGIHRVARPKSTHIVPGGKAGA